MENHSTRSISVMNNGESSPKEYLKFALVIAGITAIAWTLTVTYGPQTWVGGLRWFMGTFFVVFAAFKLVGYGMFAAMFAGYDVIAKRTEAYAYAYPFIELSLGILYLLSLVPTARDLLTLLIMGIGTIGVAQEIRKRSGIHCACLGNVIKLPLSTVSLVEDVGMGLMALAMLLMAASNYRL
jgi:hypothetical protein